MTVSGQCLCDLCVLDQEKDASARTISGFNQGMRLDALCSHISAMFTKGKLSISAFLADVAYMKDDVMMH